MFFQSLRFRLIVLVVAASLPAFVWFSISAANDRRRAYETAQIDLLRIARRAANEQTQFVDQAQVMLKDLAHRAQASRDNPPHCPDLFPDLQFQYNSFSPRYLNLGLIDSAGVIYCSLEINSGSISVAHQAYFVNAQRSLDFAVGDYEFDETTGKVFVNFGYPVLEFSGRLRAVIFATLDLNWLNEFYSESLFSPETTFTVLDRNGIVLLHYPLADQWVGQPIPQRELIGAIKRQATGGTHETVDKQNRAYLYAFAPLHSDPHYEAYVVIGIPAAEISAQAEEIFNRNLLGLSVVSGVLLFGAWLGSDWFVLRQMRMLLHTTQQVGQGNLAARTGLAHTVGEFGRLGQAFDRMSGLLEQRELERRQAQAAIQQQTARAEALVRVAARLNAQLDPDAVLQAICDETALAFEVALAAVGLFDSRRDELFVAAGRGLPPGAQTIRPPWPQAFYEQIFQRYGRLILIPELSELVSAWPQVRPFLAWGFCTVGIARIQHQNQLIGVLTIATLHTSRAFSPDEQELLLGIADQAAQAIVNARLLAETDHRARELAALYEITHDLATRHHLPSALNLILERTSGLLDVSSSALYLYDHQRDDLELIVVYGMVTQPGDRMALGEGLVGRVAQSQAPLRVHDYGQWEHRLLQGGEPGLSAAMAVPMLYGGELIGVMVVGEVESVVSRQFTVTDERLLVLIAGHAASAIRNTRLFEAEKLAHQTADTLRAANLALTRLLDLDTVLTTLLDYLSRLVPYDTASIMLLETETRLVVRATSGYERWPDVPSLLGTTLDLETLPINRVMVTNMTSRLIKDTAVESDWRWLIGSEHIRSWLGVPLVVGGRVLGLFSMDKMRPDFFVTEHVRLAEAMALQAAFAIQNAQLYAEVHTGREHLRQLAQQVVAAQEAERQRVSRELHDEAGQALVALKFQLEIIRDDVPTQSERLASQINKTAALIETTMHRIRMLAHDLRPPALEAVGLNRVLEDMCDEYAHRTQMSVYYAGEDIPQLTADVSIGLYRLLQEALTNVVKHAQAQTVRVTLARQNGQVYLTVEDDGRGFNWAAHQTESGTRGIGLIGMQERAQIMRGELLIESPSEGGTRLRVRVPWPEA